MQAAAQRMVEFWLGTFADPIYLGDWPESVKARIPYIPKINPELVILNLVGLMYTLAVYNVWALWSQGKPPLQARCLRCPPCLLEGHMAVLKVLHNG